MLLFPTRRGMGMAQKVVPSALPEVPVELVQVTAVTPLLSDAVPLSVMVSPVVETMVAAGEAIRMEGGVVSERATR